MLETQTQIIGAGLPLDPWPCAAIDSIESFAPKVMMVCLCDQQPSDETLYDRQFGNWRLCKEHGAVKLESMNGMNVMLYAADSKGDCMPLRGKA